MSDTEKLSKIETEIAFIKRWWPVVAILFTAGFFLVQTTHFFDNNIATKKDITELRTDIAEIKKIINKNTDTIYRITINNKMDNLVKEVKWIEQKRGYVAEQWINGRLVLIPVK